MERSVKLNAKADKRSSNGKSQSRIGFAVLAEVAVFDGYKLIWHLAHLTLSLLKFHVEHFNLWKHQVDVRAVIQLHPRHVLEHIAFLRLGNGNHPTPVLRQVQIDKVWESDLLTRLLPPGVILISQGSEHE